MLSGSFGAVVDCPLGKVREHTERALETAGAFSHPGVFQRRWVFPADRTVVHPRVALDYCERHWGLRHGALPDFIELAPNSGADQ